MSKKLPDILPPCDRIIVIGDLHGDWKITKEIFLKAKLIDINFKWIAEPKNTIVVQVGDIVDRGGRPSNLGDECSELKVPIREDLYINITDSFVSSSCVC